MCYFYTVRPPPTFQPLFYSAASDVYSSQGASHAAGPASASPDSILSTSVGPPPCTGRLWYSVPARFTRRASHSPRPNRELHVSSVAVCCGVSAGSASSRACAVECRAAHDNMLTN